MKHTWIVLAATMSLHVVFLAPVLAGTPGLVDPAIAVEEAVLVGSDVIVGDSFGVTTAISGDTIVVGAPSDDVPGGSEGGAAFVFVRTGTTWSEQARLVSSHPIPSAEFGYSVAIDGDTVVVGERSGYAMQADDTGAVYVFVRLGSVWTQQARLTASDALGQAAFGSSVSVHGDTAVVGATLGNSPTSWGTGAAYVFARTGSSWSEQAKLVASDGALLDRFGGSVAVDGDSVIVGAATRADQGLPSVGAAYVFTRNGATWSEQAVLEISDPTAEALAGTDVDLDSDTAIVGAPRYSSDRESKEGRAYVFARSGLSWTEQAVLRPSDPQDEEQAGRGVAIEGDLVVVGAPHDNHDGASLPGSAYVFARTGASWTQRSRLYANLPTPFAAFGYTVGIDGDSVLVSAPGAQPLSTMPAGSARVFRLSSLDAFCFGDGSLATACPCSPPNTVPAPSGGPDAGCANSFDPNGARLVASGSLNTSLELRSEIGPGYGAFAFAIKGNAELSSGIVMGDGVGCASGQLVRFGGHNAGTNGAASGEWTYPNVTQPMSIASVTAQPTGSLAVYQVVYRNAVDSFCSPATINVSNAVRVNWP